MPKLTFKVWNPTDYLRNWLTRNPDHGDGRKARAYKAGRVAMHYDVPLEQAIKLILAHTSGFDGIDPTTDPEGFLATGAREIARAYGSQHAGTGACSSSALWWNDVKPDTAYTEQVAARWPKVTVETLRGARTNQAADYDTPAILPELYFPKSLIGVGLNFSTCHNFPLEKLIARGAGGMRPEFIVPSPMRKHTGKNQQGQESSRCRETSCGLDSRRYLVVEFDHASHDVSSRLVAHLAKEHTFKLVMVVDSGGKSLHSWFNVKDAEPGKLRGFMEDAVRIGADKRMFLPEQWSRFPNGRRANGAEQPVIYFNPDACPAQEVRYGEQ